MLYKLYTAANPTHKFLGIRVDDKHIPALVDLLGLHVIMANCKYTLTSTINVKIQSYITGGKHEDVLIPPDKICSVFDLMELSVSDYVEKIEKENEARILAEEYRLWVDKIQDLVLSGEDTAKLHTFRARPPQPPTPSVGRKVST